jgi:Zn-dependent M16 (insulinase) family peptidase
MEDLHGFELLRDQHIPELNTRARIYRHIQSGAQLISLENNDENKVFGISFRTPPSDSTGIAHIMEHSVLCGSRKYPVKEPFVELMKGSLNTFLNAFTFPDKTCYPVASQNIQDFYNLVDVYLDAVFFPRLSPYTLMQEGWHYEVEDSQSPLTYKGVVFNEMKGAYSEPENVLSEQIQHSLFPDNVYHYDSGGNPVEIPNLTFEKFQEFHEMFYHPSNALIYFYGDDDPETRLVILSEYLDLFEAIPVHSEVDLQKSFTQPLKQVLPYEVAEDQEEAKNFVTVNWLLPETGDPEQIFGFNLLEEVLTGTPAAQLRKALIDSGLGEDLSGRGLDTSSRQVSYSTGLKGVKPENIDQVEKFILDTVSNLSIQGIDPDNIAAALNTVEFHLRENNTGSFPRGLVIMLRVLDFWLYGKDPIAPLCFEAPLAAIKARLAAGEPYFEHLIETYLVNNPHRTTVILTPDKELAQKRASEEQSRLEQARSKMAQEEIESVIENTRELKTRQETPDSPEALMAIPMLEREDLDKTIRTIPTEVIHGVPGKILYHDLFTNGILYLDLGFNLHTLPQEWLPYISLFSRALTEAGTEKETFVQLLQRIGQKTGGIWTSTIASAVRDHQKKGIDSSAVWLFVRSKAMAAQASDLLTILKDVLTGANLEDQDRFRQMASEEKARLESRLVGAGHGVVNSRLKAHFNEADWASEQMGGISYLFFLRDLLQKIDQDWPSVVHILKSIRETLISSSNLICNVTIDANEWSAIQPQVHDFLSQLPAHPTQKKAWQISALSGAEGLTIPSQVNFVGKGLNLFDLGYSLKGSSFVINNHLNGTWMWDKIRVQGGAYGGFATFDSQSGYFGFLSYRDPNLASSLQTYDQTGSYLKQADLDDAELTKAIIGTIGDLDAYLLPDAKGFTAMRWFLLGTTDEERQKIRDEVLGTTVDDFHQFGEYLDQGKDHGVIAALGSEESIRSTGIFQDVKKVL